MIFSILIVAWSTSEPSLPNSKIIGPKSHHPILEYCSSFESGGEWWHGHKTLNRKDNSSDSSHLFNNSWFVKFTIINPFERAKTNAFQITLERGGKGQGEGFGVTDVWTRRVITPPPSWLLYFLHFPLHSSITFGHRIFRPWHPRILTFKTKNFFRTLTPL